MTDLMRQLLGLDPIPLEHVDHGWPTEEAARKALNTEVTTMATDYKKYILSTGNHYISNSGSDENGKAVLSC